MIGDAPGFMEEPKNDYYRSEKFVVRFNKIGCMSFTKLRGPWYKRLIHKIIRRIKWRCLRKLRGWASGWRCYDVDLRAIILDNPLTDIATPEDKRFVKVVDSHVKSE